MTQYSSHNDSLFHTRKDHIIKVQALQVCDKPTENRNVTSTFSMEQAVQNAAYLKQENRRNGYHVVLEFPDKSENDASVCKEIRQILTNLLLKEMEQAG